MEPKNLFVCCLLDVVGQTTQMKVRRGDPNCWGTKAKKEKAAEAASAYVNIVALPPSIDVPRTIPIRLTDAALNGPTRPAATCRVPSATAVVVVVMVMVVRMRLRRGATPFYTGHCLEWWVLEWWLLERFAVPEP